MNKSIKENIETLKTYVPVVDRVHGDLHPEFHDVKAVFDALLSKVESLNKDFEALREITNNYEVPNDVCESYEAVYTMLSKVDKALSI